LDGLDEMQNFVTHTHETEDSFFQVAQSRHQDLNYEVAMPWHLLESHADKNNYLIFYNYQNNSFFSQGINGGWTLGAFQDKSLRNIHSLRSKLNNPWMNFTATGTSFGAIKKFVPQFDLAFVVSSGRNKFNSNEIFSELNSSTIALIEMQSKNRLPSIQLGILKENNSNNGLAGSGALNGSQNQITNFFGLSNSIDFVGGKLFGSIYWGMASNTSSSEGMIKSISDLQSSSFGLGYIAKSILRENDRIIFTIDQPIRIESGELGLDVPIYRTRQKEVLFSSFNVNLSPSGREINSRLEYSSLFRNVNLSFALGYKADPYHIKNMDDYGYISLGANIKF
jgi:hypothetical protein